MSSLEWLDPGTPGKKRAKVTYECRTLDGGRKRTSKTFSPGTPIKEIRAFQRKVETEYETSEGTDYTKRLVADFIQEYFDLYSGSLSPATLKNYKQICFEEKHGISSYFGKTLLTKLHTRDIQKYVTYLEKEGLKPKTIKNHAMMMHALYDKAIRLCYVDTNDNIVSRVELPKLRKKKVESYSSEEVKKLLSLVDRDADEMLRFEIYLAVFTGLRRSEMAALKIESIDFDKRVLHITECRVTAEKGDAVKLPKTDAGIRDIPIVGVLYRELKRIVARYHTNKLKHGAGFNDSRYIFCHENGNPWRVNNLTAKYVKFMRRHEGELRYLPLHCAGRHTYASLAVASGTDIKCVQELLGHADAATTLNVYANSYAEKKVECVNKMEQMILSREA